MEFRNTPLYEKLRWCIEDACQDSLSWGPHTTKCRNLIESILAEEIVRRNIKWWAPNRPIADEAESWLTHFFEGYQEETENGLVWNVKAFDRVYSRLEEFLYQDPYVSHFVSPLYSFSYDSSAPVELETGVCIREPDDFLSKYLKGSQELSIPYFSRLENWVADIIIEQPKSAERESEDNYMTKASEKVHTVLQSLRLLHKGAVFVGPLYYLIHPEFKGFKHNMGALFDSDLTPLPLTHPSYLRSADYQLREQDVEELKAIYRLMAKDPNHYPDSFALALSRFHDYFRRTSQLDGLLDLVIALEALFAERSQEISYRLALRCSYFLEGDIERRKDVFNRLRCIYDIRSYIVHGGPDPSTSKDLQKKMRKLRGEDADKAFALPIDDAAEYVRRAIRKIINEKHLDKLRNSEEWSKFLDDLVLEGSA